MVGTVVTENIDYYGMAGVYPALVRGIPTAPFKSLGDEAAYTVPGGKRAFAYSLPPEGICAWVTGGVLADLNPATEPRVGKTASLAKGLVLVTPAGPTSGEGMGFGAPLVRYPDGDYFSGTATVADRSTPDAHLWIKTFELDRRGIDSDRSFVAAPSRGEVVVTYRVGRGVVDITVNAAGLAAGYLEVVVLNEQSSRFDNFADSTGARIGGALGPWRPVVGAWGRFRSGTLGFEWSLPRPPAAEGVYAARELRRPGIDFSGIEYVFGPGFSATEYQLSVSNAK